MAENTSDDLEILASVALDMAKSLATVQQQMKTLQTQLQGYTIRLTAGLDKAASRAKINDDIKSLKASDIKIAGQLDTAKTRKQVKAGLSNLKAQQIKIQGVLDRVATNKSLRDQLQQLPKVEATANVKTEGAEQIENLRKQMDTASTSAVGMASKLYLARTALQLLRRTASEAVETVKELDASVTNLAIITGSRSGEIYKMLEGYNDLAHELSATTIQISDAAASWLRQGKDAAETEKLIEQSVMLSKVAMIDSETATKNLTSAMRGYKLAVEDASGVVDKLAALDSKAAVTASDLAVAMSQTASSANIGGVSMDRLLGYLATVQEATQRSAETIGQSFKTIFARMGNIKLGQFFDDEGNDLSDVESSLKHYGIALRNAEGDFCDFGEVLDDVYSKWSQFRAVDQRAIAQAFAGTRQQENFLVLMQNYGKALEYAGISADSAGTALQKFGAYQESIEAKSAEFTAAMESLTMDTVDPELVKDLIEAGTAVIEFTERIGLLKAALISLGVGGALKGVQAMATGVQNVTANVMSMGEAVTTLRRVEDVSKLTGDTITRLGTLTKGLTDDQLRLVLSTQQLTTAQMTQILTAGGLTEAQAAAKLQTLGFATAEGTATAATFTLSGAMTGLGTAIKAAFATNPIGMTMLAVGVAYELVKGITAIYDAVTVTAEEAKAAADELHSAFEETASELESVNSQLETSKDRLAELLKLSEAGTISIVEQEELGNLKEEIRLLERRQRILNDQKNSEAKESDEALVKAFDKQKFASIARNMYAAQRDALQEQYNALVAEDDFDEEVALELSNRISRIVDILAQGYDPISNIKLDKSLGFDEYVHELLEYYSELDDMEPSEMSESQISLMESLRDRLVAAASTLQTDWLDNLEIDEDTRGVWQALFDEIYDEIYEAEQFVKKLEALPSSLTTTLETLGGAGDLTAEKVNELAGEYPELQAAMDDSGYSAEEVAAHFNSLSVAQSTAAESSSDLADNLTALREAASQLQADYKLLETAQNDMSDGGGLSPETIEKLAEAEEKYLDYLYEENGVVKLNTAAWKENADAKAQDKVSALKKSLDELKAKSAQLRDNIKSYEKQRQRGSDGGLWNNQIAEATTALNENEEAIRSHEKELAIWEAAINDVQQSVSGLVPTLSNLSTVSGNMDKLSDALGSFAENGSVTVDELSSLSGIFGNLSSFESFVKVMSDSASSMEDAQNACNKLASEYIETCGILDDLSDSTAEVIERELEKMGVTNAHEVVQARLNAIEWEGVLAAKGLASAEWETAAKTLQLSGASETAIASLQRLRQEQYNAQLAANNLATASAATISSLLGQAQAAGIAANSIAALSKAAALQKRFESGNASSYELNHYEELMSGYANAAQAELTNFQGISVNLSVPAVGGGGGSSSKKVEEYIANIDDYREALERLNRVQLRKDELELDLSNADDLREQIRLRQVLIGTYQDEQEAFSNLNTLRKKTLTDETNKLRQLGFEVEYNSESNKFFVSNLEHLNELTANSKGKYDSLQEATNALREDTEKLIDSLESLNEDNQEGAKSWVELKNSIREAKISIIDSLKEIVSEASDAVDEIQNVYDTLHEAADEYAEYGGFLSIDTVQKIYSLGAQYMQYLKDENGLLVINEENINKVIAARTQQLAAEQAVTYVERLRLALQKDSIEDLNTLLYATTEATDATFGLAYAELALMHSLGDLDDQQYAAAVHNIQSIENLANSAIASIGKTADSYREKLEEMKSGIDDILKYVMDMLKHRINEQIDALEEMKDAYSDVIDEKKESLKASKDEADYQKSMAKKLREIAKLQARIDALSLDSSREAQAKRAKLLEEMAELQEEVAEKQADKTLEATEDALDDMEKAYHAEKDKEIKILEDSISSYQKLYDTAIEYIENHWDTLYGELIDWNTQYGDVLNSEITTAWENCLAAAQKYGSYVSALNSIDADISATQSAGQNFIVSNTGNSGSYSKDDEIHVRLKEMYQNAQAWHSASTSGRAYLDSRNLQLGTELNALGIDAERRNGTWYAGNDLLFEKYKKYIYHKGGIVGDNGTLKDNEVLAKLEKGETVLTEQMWNNLSTRFDRMKAMEAAFTDIPDYAGKFATAEILKVSGLGTVNNVTNNSSSQPIEINIGDTIIHGANGDTVQQHEAATRDMVNQIARMLRKTM